MPHVRTSVHGTKMMGAAQRSLSLDWRQPNSRMIVGRCGESVRWAAPIVFVHTLVRTWGTVGLFGR